MIGVRRGRGTREALLALVPQIKERMQNGNRTVLRDVIPELEDRQVFLYPRHTRDPCLRFGRCDRNTFRNMRCVSCGYLCPASPPDLRSFSNANEFF